MTKITVRFFNRPVPEDEPQQVKLEFQVTKSHLSENRQRPSEHDILCFVDKATLTALIQSAPADHSLRTAGEDYRDSFVSAFLAVYGHKSDRQATEILKRKFLLRLLEFVDHV
jgi:hypothetical protein